MNRLVTFCYCLMVLLWGITFLLLIDPTIFGSLLNKNNAFTYYRILTEYDTLIIISYCIESLILLVLSYVCGYIDARNKNIKENF